MDDSGEVIIAINHSFQEENDGEITIPLNEQKVDSVDYAEQTISHDKEQYLFVNELKNLKSLFHDQLGEITHDFSNCQKEVICAVNQIKRDFKDEISSIKGRVSQMEDDVHENKKNISTIYKMMEQDKDLVNHSNHMSDVVNTENISEVISGVGQAVPSANIKMNQNTEKQQQNTYNIYLFNKDKMCNVNQNYAVLDRPLVLRLTNSHTHSPKSINVTMKPQLYEGDEDLNEYLAQFEILAEINGWNYATKSLYLAGSLKGGARALLNELDKESRKDYDSLVKVLDNRYGSAEKSELFRAKLQTRMRGGKEESLPELAQSIKKLTRQAYSSAPSTITSVLALEHFIDALPDADLRLRLRESNPKSIHEAETLAVRLETLKSAEIQKGRMVRQADTVHNENNTINTELNNGKGEDFKSLRHELSDFKKELVSLTRDIKGMSQNKNRNSQGGGNQQRNYQNGQRGYNNQNKNFGQGNRNFIQRNNNFGQNRQNQPNYYQQGNQLRSDSGVGARPSQNGPNR
ncbi:unnamed protein product [Mytilus coruscus]|uniref:Uncharacterized protein n=1 Tax=Mytilus coruscus TaxID=42192 RepID=A0A6J8BIK5_MYTCO|nr:unnamed protein product [Mytilus coruscus]